MSDHFSFWQRVGNVFRGGQLGSPDTNGNRHATKISAAEPPLDDGPPRPLTRWGRREPTVAQMRDGYQRVVETMDALQEHFSKQDQRAEHLGQSITHLVGTLDQLAETGHNQQEHVRSIADNVSQAGRHAAAISASLSQMPKSLQMQAESVQTMLRRIEISQESDTQLMHSLQHLGRAVEGLNASGAAQVQTLERLHAADHDQKEALTSLVREQSRRFLIVMVVAAILVLGTLAALAVTVMLQLGQ